eukprot:7730208-Karenia_brevis.AAC.1
MLKDQEEDVCGNRTLNMGWACLGACQRKQGYRSCGHRLPCKAWVWDGTRAGPYCDHKALQLLHQAREDEPG